MNTRRDFIKNISFASVAVTLPFNIGCFKKQKLIYSTIAVPDWELSKIVGYAKEQGLAGIEIRGIKRELDLTKVPEFSTQHIATTRRMLRDQKQKIIGLGSSAQMHHSDLRKRKENIDEGKRFIDLAQKLDCPYVRVFPNQIPKDIPKQKTFDLIIDGLNVLSAYAKGSNVTVLMETHGELVWADDLLAVMQRVADNSVGLIWDVSNMWSITNEDPADVFGKIGKYFKHIHLKDAITKNQKVDYVLTGEGNVPLKKAVQLLYNNKYKGYYCFEWEKLWVPEIAPSEIAIPHFKKIMNSYFHSF